MPFFIYRLLVFGSHPPAGGRKFRVVTRDLSGGSFCFLFTTFVVHVLHPRHTTRSHRILPQDLSPITNQPPKFAATCRDSNFSSDTPNNHRRKIESQRRFVCYIYVMGRYVRYTKELGRKVANGARSSGRRYHVVSSFNRPGWSVIAEGAGRTYKGFRTKQEAISFAKQSNRNSLIEVVVHNKDGYIQDVIALNAK